LKKITEKATEVLPASSTKKGCAAKFSVLQEKFVCVYRKQNVSLFMMTVGLSPGKVQSPMFLVFV
jgi:hypothetical protein